MKTRAIISTILLIGFSVIAVIFNKFPGWDKLKDTSPYIIVVQCGKPTPPTPNVFEVGPRFDSEIEVISVLKGTNIVSAARLITDHQLWQGENYLIFGFYDGGIYRAFENYRVIQLDHGFSTNLIAGKSLDEQIQILFQRRLFYLNRQMQDEQEEKQWLEAGIVK